MSIMIFHHVICFCGPRNSLANELEFEVHFERIELHENSGPRFFAMITRRGSVVDVDGWDNGILGTPLSVISLLKHRAQAQLWMG